MLEQVKQYLEQLNERERQMVYVAAIAIAVFLPYQLAWVPFMSAIDSLDNKVLQQEQDLLWMQGKVSEVIQLNNAVRGAVKSGRSLYGVIENTARQSFGNDIRVDQEGDNGIRVRVKETGFDKMLLWLDELQLRHKIFIKEFKVDRAASVGNVTANILIEGQ